jgi:hypothetical protein
LPIDVSYVTDVIDVVGVGVGVEVGVGLVVVVDPDPDLPLFTLPLLPPMVVAELEVPHELSRGETARTADATRMDLSLRLCADEFAIISYPRSVPASDPNGHQFTTGGFCASTY